MNVFGYIRVSGKGQLDGDGPERQKLAIEDFCRNQKLDLTQLFQDTISGTIDGMNRPKFTELLYHTEERKVKAIVVERMDRLARDLMVSEVMLAHCRKRNIQVFSSDQGNIIDMASDGGDPTRVLIRQIIGALSQWEKTNLVQKLRVGRERKKLKSGGKCEGRKKYGDLPGEQTIVDLIVHMRKSEMILKNIAGCLNLEGFKTRFNKKWNVFSVLHILEREGVTGICAGHTSNT
jgi:DNA invertase Pin-like site-specific DNA recombinase